MSGMRRAFAIALTLALSVAAGAAPRPASKPAAKLIQSCDAHKFETVVTATVDGQPHQSKVKLCGVEGQSDADWMNTLHDAIRKLDADKQMQPAVRDQIKKAIDAEIARLKIESAMPGNKNAAAKTPSGPLPPPRQAADTPISRDFAALPPLPTEPPPPPHVLGAAVAESSPSPGLPDVPAAPRIAVAAPRLSFACYSPGDMVSDAPCAEFERETMLTVSAAGKVPAGAALRFVRNGEARADVELASLSRGNPLRMPLPRDVCAGFGAGRLELQVVEDGAVVSSDGPYALRCY